MVDEKTYHLINDYLSGELQGTALDIFKSRLNTEKKLQKALKEQKAIIAAINESREQELRTIMRSSKRQTKVIAIGPYLKIVGIGAAAVALLVVVFFSLKPLISNLKNDHNTAKETKDKHNRPIEDTAEDSADNITEDNALADAEKTTTDTQTLAINAPQPDDILEIAELDIEPIEADEAEEELSSDVETDNITEKKTAATGYKDADVEVVRTDQLLIAKRFLISTLSPNFEEKEQKVNLEEITVTSNRAGKIKKDRATADEASKPEAPNKSLPATRAIGVEYWSSVVNYKGYKYTGEKVQLYGVDQNTPLNFKELDNRLYVKINGTQYFLEKNNKYNRMVEVTNPTLLKVLNE